MQIDEHRPDSGLGLLQIELQNLRGVAEPASGRGSAAPLFASFVEAAVERSRLVSRRQVSCIQVSCFRSRVFMNRGA
jgi:hypothetical protein